MELVPPHMQVVNFLEQEIRTSMKPGDRLESERSLAVRLNVSRITISKSLAVLTQRGLISRRHGSGSIVLAPQEAVASKKWFGVLLEFDIGNPHCAWFLRQAAQCCRRRLQERGILTRFYAGFSDVVDHASAPTCEDFVYDLEQGSLMGAVLLGGADAAGTRALAEKHGLPVVGTNANYRHWVTSNRIAMVRHFVRHAFNQGRRRFGLLTWDGGDYYREWHGSMRLRDALEEALRELGLEMTPEWVRDDLPPAIPGSGWEEFREIWSAKQEHPDAVIVGDEYLLPDVGRVWEGLNVPPGALSIYGCATREMNHSLPFPVHLAELDVESFADALVGVSLKLLEDPSIAPIQKLVPYTWEEPSENAEADTLPLHPGTILNPQ